MRASRWSAALVLLLALTVRGAVFTYNETVNSEPVGSGAAQLQLAKAQAMLAGKSPEHTYVEDYGISYVHVALGLWDGAPSFQRLMAFQMIVDGLMAAAAWRIGLLLGGLTTAGVAGALYALYIPQVILSATPDYDVWATWGLLTPTLLALEARRLAGPGQRSVVRAGGAAAVAGATVAAAAVVRSSVLYFGPMLGGAVALLGARLSARWLWLGATVVAGWLVVVLGIATHNLALFGTPRLVRGSIGHSFWAGVGQFPNSYGLEDRDGSVNEFYERLDGPKAPWMSEEYDRRLREDAVDFVRREPGTFLSNAVRRTVWILFPRHYWGLWADTWHPAYQPFSTTISDSGGVWMAATRDPVRALLATAGRAVDFVLLPLSLALALVGVRRTDVWLGSLPLIYTAATQAPFYVTARTTASAYAALLPVCAVGIVWLGSRLVPVSRRFAAARRTA